MLLLDENMPENQRRLLLGWRIRIRQIGVDYGRKGTTDDRILTLLHQLRAVTFFTRDLGFLWGANPHGTYCLVCLAVGQQEAAHFVRRFLRHPSFSTWKRRRGTIVRASQLGILERRSCDREWREISWPKQ